MKSQNATVVFFSTSLASAILLMTSVMCALVDEPDTWQIHGRVVDEQGKPVDDFVAATLWSSNGKRWDDDGNPIKINDPTDARKIWKEEGVLTADPKCVAQRLAINEFVATIDDQSRVAILVVDKDQRRGGFATVEKAANSKPMTITLLPLVRVHGRIYCPEAGKTPNWTFVGVQAPADSRHETRITFCGSFKGEFSFLLPPGKYDLDVYSQSPDAEMPTPAKWPNHDAPADMPAGLRGIRMDVPAGKPTFDLGVLDVVPFNYARYYGKEPPALEITDARGVAKGVQLANFRGKWVLVEFWEFSCSVCIERNLPALAKFYEEHAADRKRFEILSICFTEPDKVTTVAEYERLEAPLVGKVWKGKRLPFPILIDGAGKTCATYGVNGYPTTLLIDPEGHLVENGDEAMLVEKLKEKQP